MKNDEPNQHKAKVPWNLKVDKDASWRACDALVQGNDRELQGVVDMTSWSLDTLKQIRSRLLDGLRAGLDEARLDRWITGGFARQIFRQFGEKRCCHHRACLFGLLQDARRCFRLVLGKR